MPKASQRPLIQLTLEVGETYNKILEQSQSQQKQRSIMTDEKGYFIAYENQVVQGEPTSKYQYTIKKALGQGSFGRVMLVEYQDGDVLKQAALKICRAQPYFIDAMRQEIQIFQQIARDFASITATFIEDFCIGQHVCYTMELFEMTLYQSLKQSQGSGFPLPQVKIIARQFGQWLNGLETLKIVHTDMKPENMVMNKQDLNNIKLIDFGSGVFMDQPQRPTYIQSRFYRAPEITFGFRYDYKIDSWSIGALLLELHTCYTCFPAKSSPMLMKMFISILGMPPKHFVYNEDGSLRTKMERYFIQPTDQFWTSNQTMLEAMGVDQHAHAYPNDDVLNVEDRVQCSKRNLKELIYNRRFQGQPGHSEEDYMAFFELISHLIVWEAGARWTGKQILESKFCQ